MISEIELEFLRESNNIEDEWDDKALEDAILAWQYCREAKNLTREVVLEVHRLIMRSRKTIKEEDKGRLRNGAVWIGGREAKKWFVLEALLVQWLENANSTGQTLGMAEKWAKECHIEYENMHPFFDGNGRTGRIFYNWQRLSWGLPIHVIHVGKEQREYYKWF